MVKALAYKALAYTVARAERAGVYQRSRSGHARGVQRVMSLPLAALGAIVTALLETSVLSELSISGLTPALVLVLVVVVAMAIGFEESLVWAVAGGILLDALSGRPLGATGLALLVVAGLAGLIARFTGSPRLLTVGLATFSLSWLFLALMVAILAATADVGVTPVPIVTFAIVAALNTGVALVVVLALRALMRRFGNTERIDW